MNWSTQRGRKAWPPDCESIAANRKLGLVGSSLPVIERKSGTKLHVNSIGSPCEPKPAPDQRPPRKYRSPKSPDCCANHAFIIDSCSLAITSTGVPSAKQKWAGPRSELAVLG